VGLKQPIGEDLVVATTNGNTLPATGFGEERTFDFGAGVELTEGKAYAIVITAPDTIPYDMYNWAQTNAAGVEPGYGPGHLTSYDGGLTWINAGSESPDHYHLWFKAYEGANLRDSFVYDFYGGGILYGPWVRYTLDAYMFIASSTYTLTSIVLTLYKFDENSTPGTIFVSIRNTTDWVSKPTNPSPPDGASNVTLGQATVLSWDSGEGATSYNVYYGENEEGLTLVSAGQLGTSYINTDVDYEVNRAWRVDAINGSAIATGDVWTFSTISFYPPTTGEVPTHKRLVAAAENTIWYEDI